MAFFCILDTTTKALHIVLNEINLINPNIGITMNHTYLPGEHEKYKCGCEPKSAIPFLDTLCLKKERRIDTDLYNKKRTEINIFFKVAAIQRIKSFFTMEY